jgi:putative two-component system response regulator
MKMDPRRNILLVDDDPVVLEVINECLQPYYQTRIAMRGAKALELARLHPLPDLVLLDVDLPDMQGYEVCTELKNDPLSAQIPVIFLSSHSDVGDITRGLGLGAVDYVTKPVAPPILLARVQTHLRLREARDLLQDQNAHLEHLVSKRTRDLETKTTELQSSQDLTIVALGSIAETRDNETGNHIHRTRAYVEVLARLLGKTAKFSAIARTKDWEMIWKFAPLHDIGKVGIPDSILLKPGSLTAEEFNVMKRHTVLGRDALRLAEDRVDMYGAFFRIAMEIAYSHHERWNGSGYPEGLSGEAIPLAARLMAVADVYDALISKRVYKEAMPHETAVDIICGESGKHFDPRVVDCFIEAADEFRIIASRFSDT